MRGDRALTALASLLMLGGGPMGRAGATEVYIVGEKAPPKEDLGPEHVKISPLRDHQYSERFAIERVEVAPDGSEIVALTKASREGPRSWDLGAGRSMKLPPMSRDVGNLAFSPDKELIAVSILADVLSGERAGIELLRMSDGVSTGFLIGGESARALSFSPDGRQLAAATDDGILMFSLPGGKSRLVIPLSGGADAVRFIGPSELVVATDSGARLFRADDQGATIESWEGKRERGALCFSPTGRFLAIGGEGELRIVDLHKGGGAQRVRLPGQVTAIGWSMSGQVLAAGTNGGLLHVFAVEGAPGLTALSSPGSGGDSGRGAARPERASGSREEERATDDGAAADRGAAPGRTTSGTTSADRGAAEDSSAADPLGDLRGLTGSTGSSAPSGGAGASPVELSATVRVLLLEGMSSDPRNGASLEKALGANLKRIEPCWKKQARAGNIGAGRLIIELGVTANGEGVAIEAPAEDSVGSDKVISCLAERLREPLFGPGLGSLTIELTIELSAR